VEHSADSLRAAKQDQNYELARQVQRARQAKLDTSTGDHRLDLANPLDDVQAKLKSVEEE
jgi:hypothetical protein